MQSPSGAPLGPGMFRLTPKALTPLFAGVVAAAVLGAVVGATIVAFAGWNLGKFTLVGIAGLAGAVVVVSSLLGIAVMLLFAAGDPRRVPLGVLGLSATRLISGLGLGMFLFLAMGVEKSPFWTCFLMSMFPAICVETAWAVTTARRAAPMAGLKVAPSGAGVP